MSSDRFIGQSCHVYPIIRTLITIITTTYPLRDELLENYGEWGGGVAYRCSISMQTFFPRNLFVAGFVLLGNSLEGQGRFFLVYSLRTNFSPQFSLSRSPLTQTKSNVIFSSPTVSLLTAHCDIFSFKRRDLSAISQQCFIGLIPFIQ